MTSSAAMTEGLSRIAARLAARTPTAGDGDAEKRAAVAAIFRERDAAIGPELLFIRRADKTSDPWSGQMAFPGGRHDPRDADLLETARRETREEIGLDLAGAELLGRLDPIGAVARAVRLPLTITPFVFAIGAADPALVAHPDEVAEVLWTPITPLLQGEAEATHPYLHDGQRYDMPAFRVGDRMIWGLTYRMLQDLFAAIR